jgi:thioredoxin-like negative regulator of GroEL
MPDFLLPSIEGPPHRLSDWRGKPTIVAFWAFWCSTWKEVNAGFDTVAIQAGTRCHLVTVDIDCQWKDQLTRPREVPYVALMDPRSEVSKRWDIGAVPTVFVVDSHGVLCQRYQGYPGNAALGAWIDRLQQGANP